MINVTATAAARIDLDVQAHWRRCQAQWWNAPDGLPDLGPTYSRAEQAEREAAIGHLVDRALKATEAGPVNADQEAALRQQLMPDGLRVLALALGLEAEELRALQPEALAEVALEFARQARRFDPTLSPADIFQAGRNVMTANVLQLLLARPVALTPAIFAYSLLYPYTDNLLDDPRLPAADKRAFNARFRRRLAGDAVVPASHRERLIGELVALIEGQFSRARYPQVYASLLAIHAAQGDSLRLLRPQAAPYELDVLGLTLAKGGTSVLADGCLVAGCLNPAEAECLHGLGAYLQLMDDLEDVDRDRREGRQTLFAAALPHWTLDALTSRTLQFGAWVLASFDHLDAPEAELCRSAIKRCMLLPALQLAGAAPRHYSRAYLAALEAHSPFRFAFARQQQRRLAGRRGQWLRLLDAYTGPGRAGPPLFRTLTTLDALPSP